MKTIEGKQVIFEFTPELKSTYIVNPNEEFKVATKDCFFGQIDSEDKYYNSIDRSLLNSATGPIEIAGAKPGDVLKIHILNIEVESKGVMVLAPDEGTLGHRISATSSRILEVNNGIVTIGGIDFKIDPMIGVIGVATKEGSVPTVDPGYHGGNMDTKEIRKGSILYLPVNQSGAMLAMGDVHALMGDGELSCSGLEIGAEITLSIEVLTDSDIEIPIVETEDEIMAIASEETLEKGFSAATGEIVKLLMADKGLSFEDAYLIAGLVVDLRISQVVNSIPTVKAAIPKEYLNLN